MLRVSMIEVDVGPFQPKKHIPNMEPPKPNSLEK
jgi:hypothetical protein